MRTRSFFLAATAAVLVACGGTATDPDNPSNSGPVGRYTLATVNGSRVPMLWDEMPVWPGGPMLRAYWNGGTLELRADSTYTVAYRHSLTGPNLPGTVQEDTYTGVWRLRAPSGIDLMPNAGGVQPLQAASSFRSITRTTSVPALNGATEQVVFVFVRN